MPCVLLSMHAPLPALRRWLAPQLRLNHVLCTVCCTGTERYSAYYSVVSASFPERNRKRAAKHTPEGLRIKNHILYAKPIQMGDHVAETWCLASHGAHRLAPTHMSSFARLSFSPIQAKSAGARV